MTTPLPSRTTPLFLSPHFRARANTAASASASTTGIVDDGQVTSNIVGIGIGFVGAAFFAIIVSFLVRLFLARRRARRAGNPLPGAWDVFFEGLNSRNAQGHPLGLNRGGAPIGGGLAWWGWDTGGQGGRGMLDEEGFWDGPMGARGAGKGGFGKKPRLWEVGLPEREDEQAIGEMKQLEVDQREWVPTSVTRTYILPPNPNPYMKQPIPPLSAGQDVFATYIILMPQETSTTGAAEGGSPAAAREEGDNERSGRSVKTKSRPSSRFPSPSRVDPALLPNPTPAPLTRQLTTATYKTTYDDYTDDSDLPELVLGVQVMSVEQNLGNELTRSVTTHTGGGRKMSLAATLADKAKHLKERGSIASGIGTAGHRPAGTNFNPGSGSGGAGTIPEGMDEQMAEHLAALQRLGVQSPLAIPMGRIM